MRQIDDISRIAANAVRRHPERQRVVIGVNLGKLHEMVMDSLLEGTFGEKKSDPGS